MADLSTSYSLALTQVLGHDLKVASIDANWYAYRQSIRLRLRLVSAYALRRSSIHFQFDSPDRQVTTHNSRSHCSSHHSYWYRYICPPILSMSASLVMQGLAPYVICQTRSVAVAPWIMPSRWVLLLVWNSSFLHAQESASSAALVGWGLGNSFFHANKIIDNIVF